MNHPQPLLIVLHGPARGKAIRLPAHAAARLVLQGVCKYADQQPEHHPADVAAAPELAPAPEVETAMAEPETVKAARVSRPERRKAKKVSKKSSKRKSKE